MKHKKPVQRFFRVGTSALCRNIRSILCYPPTGIRLIQPCALIEKRIKNIPKKGFSPGTKSQTVEFFGGDWKTSLFGNFEVDEQGAFIFTECLTDRFLCLTQILSAKRLPLSPSMADLIDITTRMKLHPPARWPSMFRELFALELRLTRVSMDELEMHMQVQASTDSLSQEHPLVKRVNQLKWLKHPVTVKAGLTVGYDVAEHCLSLPGCLSEKDQFELAESLLNKHNVILSESDFEAWSGLPDYLLRPEHYPHMQELDLTWPEKQTINAPIPELLQSALAQTATSVPDQLSATIELDGEALSDAGNILLEHKRFAGSEYTPEDYRLGIYTPKINQSRNISYRFVKPNSTGISYEPATRSWPTDDRILLNAGEVTGLKDLIEKFCHHPASDILHVRQRMMSFFLSDVFIQSLSKKPQYESLIDSALALGKSDFDNNQYLSTLLKSYSQAPSFNYNALCDVAYHLLASEHYNIQDVDILEVLEVMQANPRYQAMAREKLGAFYKNTFTSPQKVG